MGKREIIRRHEQTKRLTKLLEDIGFYDEATNLLRISQTLHRWAEQKCNGDVTVDERTGDTYRQYGNSNGPFLTARCPNLKAGALRRLEAILEGTEWTYYDQTDPRGASLYLIPRDVAETKGAEWVRCNYSSIGIPIY